jgi:hypothetical protein
MYCNLSELNYIFSNPFSCTLSTKAEKTIIIGEVPKFNPEGPRDSNVCSL